MIDIKLEKNEINNLDIVSCQYNLRKDFINFIEYCDDYDVKRTHRDNNIPKTDLRRIAKLFAYKDIIEEVKNDGKSLYINFIDNLAYELDLIDYSIEGEYMGYSSREPSFPDNYIVVKSNKLNQYYKQSLYEQDNILLNKIISIYNNYNNEFKKVQYHSRLDRFSGWNNRGVTKYIEFDKGRKFMLSLLNQLPAGEWYSTKSLVKYVKFTNPYFLIPKKIKRDRWDDKERYAGICEVMAKDVNKHNADILINEKDPDAFERAEGLWIERFLEYIPLIMGFVDVAYDKDFSTKKYPLTNKLKAFKINQSLKNYYNKNYNIKITLQPNFDLIIESSVYPMSIANKFIYLCNIVTEQPHLVLHLDKKKIIKGHADNEKLNIVKELEQVVSNIIPNNVKVELNEWIKQTEKFVLYSGFNLFENNDKNSNKTDLKYAIDKNLSLIKNATTLYNNLLKTGKAPISISHSDDKFKTLPKVAKTVFVKVARTTKKASIKEKVGISADTYVFYKINNKVFYKELLLKCVNDKLIENYDDAKLTISFNKKLEKRVDAIVKQLKTKYTVSIKH